MSFTSQAQTVSGLPLPGATLSTPPCSQVDTTALHSLCSGNFFPQGFLFLESFTRNQPDASSDSHCLGNETLLQAPTERLGGSWERCSLPERPPPRAPAPPAPRLPARRQLKRSSETQALPARRAASHQILVKSSGRRQLPPLPAHFILKDPGNFSSSVFSVRGGCLMPGDQEEETLPWPSGLGAGVLSLHCTF